SDRGNEQYESARLWIAVIAAGALVVALGIGAWLILGITRGLSLVSRAMTDVAEGDLTKAVSASTNDEIKDLVETLNAMVDRLRGVVG
ncbi:HAMP domain-containing protein, partial [Pseudomonas sp. GW460-12]|uniref:HAMP domain-containing protein n=1 Tax=Pseudomonas sp. GW460-12 TaxID=2070621 RepID=UPI000CCA9867